MLGSAGKCWVVLDSVGLGRVMQDHDWLCCLRCNVRPDSQRDLCGLCLGDRLTLLRFQRLTVDKPTARALFATNRFKLGLIDSIPEGDPITVYRCGEFIDLCRGPHVPHTGLLKVNIFPAVLASWLIAL